MKNNKNNKNKYPFANEVKEMKDNFKRMIDSMSDDEFLDFIEYINACTEIFDEDFNYIFMKITERRYKHDFTL